MPLPQIKKILQAISNLSLKTALTYLVGQGIYGFSRIGYEQIKKVVQDKQNENIYAFVPSKNEALKLLELKNNEGYRAISLLIPNYRYIDLIRTGLLIDEYQKAGRRFRDKIIVIKNQIAKRPNGRYLLKIVNLPTTPFFSIILEYLYDLKKRGYSDSLLIDTFSEIIDMWQDSTKFVESFDKIEDVIGFIKTQVAQNKSVFFVLGMKTAGKIAQNAAIKLDDFLKEKGYITKITIGELRKVEIIINKES